MVNAYPFPLPQQHAKDPGHSAKSASERLQLNPHAPYACAKGSSHGSDALSSFPLCSWPYSVFKEGGGLVDCASSDLTIDCLTAHWQGVRGFFRVCVLLQWFLLCHGGQDVCEMIDKKTEGETSYPIFKDSYPLTPCGLWRV